jgi:hypothetical protein
MYRLSLAFAALAAAPSASQADVILGSNVLFNADEAFFLTPGRKMNFFPPGSPNSNSQVNKSPTVPGSYCLAFSNSYTYLDNTGRPVGATDSATTTHVCYQQLTPSSLRISTTVTVSNDGHTLNNSGWHAGDVATAEVQAIDFMIGAPMRFTYHETSLESETGAYTFIGTGGSLSKGSTTIASGLSYLNVFGNEGQRPFSIPQYQESCFQALTGSNSEARGTARRSTMVATTSPRPRPAPSR